MPRRDDVVVIRGIYYIIDILHPRRSEKRNVGGYRQSWRRPCGGWSAEAAMRIRTGREIGVMWVVVGTAFIAMVMVIRAVGRSASTQTASLVIGYVGLAAVGASLLITSRWVYQRGPRSMAIRAGLLALIALVFVLWLVALVFPFL
jgi:hypothetical protein